MSDICTNYGRDVPIEFIRQFRSGTRNGVGFDTLDADHASWFVYMTDDADIWHCHCGPYSTREQAVDWIQSIREEKSYAR